MNYGRRWVMLGRARGLILDEKNDGKPGGVRAVRVAVPGVGLLWWPRRLVRPAGLLDVIAGELDLMARGVPGQL